MMLGKVTHDLPGDSRTQLDEARDHLDHMDHFRIPEVPCNKGSEKSRFSLILFPSVDLHAFCIVLLSVSFSITCMLHHI
jgi:hypothetical protein